MVNNVPGNRTANGVPGIHPQPLSGKDYAGIAILMLVIGIGLLILFVLFAPRLVPADVLGQFFYIVLLVFGLVCALVLAGAMNSYARVTHTSPNGVVEVGGPAAVALLVVVGGFLLVPRSDTFDLTIRPHAPDKPLITSGKIRVELGNSAPTQEINSNGEADFKGVPHKYRGATVRVLPLVEGYKQEYQTKVISGDALDLDLVKPETMLSAKLVPSPAQAQRVKVLIESEPGEQVPDRYGRFQALVHKNVTDKVRITVCSNGRSIFNDYVTLAADEIEIPTHKPGVRCGD